MSLMFTRCSFDEKENKLNYYRGKDCIEKLCKKLKERAMKIIDYEEKEMIPLTHEEKIPLTQTNLRVKLTVLEKIWKNISLFLYQLRKNVIMVKKLHINLGLLIVLDLCQLHYQNLLIICLEFLIV